MDTPFDKVGTYPLMAEPFHVDFTGRLTLGVLGNHLLNAAGCHANDRGFGIGTVNEDNYTWVLSRLAIDLYDMPREYEHFTVQTWIEDVYRLFTKRNFAILDSHGNPLGYARSVWAMISMSTRKPADLLALLGDGIRQYICNKPCPMESPSRIAAVSGEAQKELTMLYSDIDINRHVNSIRYIEHILDLFPIECYETKRIKRFEIAYVTESRYSDKLSFYSRQENPDEWHVAIRKGEELSCRAKLIFTEMQENVPGQQAT